ncbi:unnamed protein product [Caenorhabditis brenneri]
MQSDDDDLPQNLTGGDEPDETPHGEFDLTSIYSSLSQEASHNSEKLRTRIPLFQPVDMDQLLSGAKKFGNSHRHLINQFCLEPTMSAKKMNLVFASHLTTVKLKRHPEVVMRIQATPETSKELTKALVKTLNTENGIQKKDFRPWRFVISTDEKTPTEYVTMTGCTRNSSIISEASEMTKAERALFFAIVEEMLISDGEVPMTLIYKMIQQEPHKIPGTKLDVFLNRMVRQKHFSMDEDMEFLEISPRTLVELEAWIRAKFAAELKMCTLCRKIIARPIYTAECKKCHALFHFNCFRNATVIADQDHLQCGKCDERITKFEVEEQMEAKRVEGRARAKSRAQNPRQTRRTPVVDLEENKEEEEDEEEKKTNETKIEVDTDDDQPGTLDRRKRKAAPPKRKKIILASSDSDSD